MWKTKNTLSMTEKAERDQYNKKFFKGKQRKKQKKKKQNRSKMLCYILLIDLYLSSVDLT